MSYRVIIELYAVLLIVNIFIGVTQTEYQSGNPTGVLRSPFTGYPIASTLPTVSAINNTIIVSQNNILGNINYTSGTTIPFISTVSDAFQSIASIFNAVITFIKFFSLGFLIDMLNGLGFPSVFLYIVTIPVGFYLLYMIFTMVANKLGY